MSRKQLEGKIKSLSGARTVSVSVVRVFHHPRYRKRVRASKTYLAHLEGGAEVGQNVVIEESRPISKRKRWMVVELEGKPVTVDQKTEIQEQPKPKAVGRSRKNSRSRPSGGRAKK